MFCVPCPGNLDAPKGTHISTHARTCQAPDTSSTPVTVALVVSIRTCARDNRKTDTDRGTTTETDGESGGNSRREQIHTTNKQDHGLTRLRHKSFRRLLPGFSPSFARLSPGFRPSFARLSPGFRPSFARLSPGFRQAFIRLLPGLCQAFARLSSGFRQAFVRLSSGFRQAFVRLSPVLRQA